MTHYAGSALYAEFGGVAINTDFKSLDINETQDIADSTAGADAARSHVRTVRSIDASLSALFNGTAGSAVMAALQAGAQGTLTFGQIGTATGAPKYSVVMTVTAFNKSIQFDGTQEMSASLMGDGDWLLNYERSGSVW